MSEVDTPIETTDVLEGFTIPEDFELTEEPVEEQPEATEEPAEEPVEEEPVGDPEIKTGSAPEPADA